MNGAGLTLRLFLKSLIYKGKLGMRSKVHRLWGKLFKGTDFFYQRKKEKTKKKKRKHTVINI